MKISGTRAATCVSVVPFVCQATLTDISQNLTESDTHSFLLTTISFALVLTLPPQILKENKSLGDSSTKIYKIIKVSVIVFLTCQLK